MGKQYKNFPFPLPDKSEEPKEEHNNFVVPHPIFNWTNLFIVLNLIIGLDYILRIFWPSIGRFFYIANINIDSLILVATNVKVISFLFGLILIIATLGLFFKKRWAFYLIMLELGFYVVKSIYELIVYRWMMINLLSIGIATILFLVINCLWAIHFYKRRDDFNISYFLTKKILAVYILSSCLLFAIVSGIITMVNKGSFEPVDFSKLPEFSMPKVDLTEVKEWPSYTYRDLGITIKYPPDFIFEKEYKGRTIKYPSFKEKNLSCVFQADSAPLTASNEYTEVTKAKTIIDNQMVEIIEIRSKQDNFYSINVRIPNGKYYEFAFFPRKTGNFNDCLDKIYKSLSSIKFTVI